MPYFWIAVAVAVAAVLAGLYLLTRRTNRVVYANPREERLAQALARTVGCDPAQALPAVRREVSISPNQSDETLLKRGAYHYRMEMPEGSCPVYRERKAAPG